MFIVSLHYVVGLDRIDAARDAHIAFLDKYYANGTFIASGRKEPRTGGIILARAESLPVLEKVLDEDPFRQQGLAEYQVTEFIVSKTAPGLEALHDA
ncbi:MAG TPA: YciI family protein [Devosiaceae bacterium]